MDGAPIGRMEAGQQLDTVIQELIFGDSVDPPSDTEAELVAGVWRRKDDGRPIVAAWQVPHYSTDVAAAWKIVECFWRVNVVKGDTLSSGEVYTCYIWPHEHAGVLPFEGHGPTAALAICRAALAARNGA